jgi:hypothetical protein
MSESVHLRNVKVLAGMRNALHRFGGAVGESLDRTENALRRTLDDMQQKLIRAQISLKQYQQSVQYTQDAVKNCENQEKDDDDNPPDCGQELDDLRLAKRERADAEKRLNLTRMWLSRVEKQIQDYRNMAGHTKRLVTQRSAQAIAILQNKISEVEKYQLIQAISAANSITGSDPPSTHNPDIQGSGVASIATARMSSGGVLQAENAGLHTDGAHKWVELGIRNVDLKDLPSIDDIDESQFNKVSMRDMQAGLERHQEMQRLIDLGQENTKEHWAKVDREKGFQYSEGYQRIYEAFHGTEPIRLNKDGNKYTIENGRHRLWLAKRMGISVLPASIVERKTGTQP